MPNHPDGSLIERARAAMRREGLVPVLRDSPAAPVEIEGYDLIREIGRGGQGIVYQAMQRSTQRHVAIQVLRHGLLASSGEQARLEREVRILAQLRHPGIVAVHDSGRNGSLSYIVMDLIDGMPLDAYVAAERLPMRERVELFAQIAETVNAAHVRGIIHRDLKPANIRIDAEGRPHVLDFGVAKLLEPDSVLPTLTMTGQFVGSLQWAAPEQARGDQAAVDVRTDVHALGVIFWHTLTGAFPYAVDGDMTRVLANIVSAEPTRPSRNGQRLPIDLETILRRCLAKEPGRRYQNAGELATDLGCYLDGRPIAARRDSQWYVLRRTIARHRAVASLAAAIFLLTVLAAVGLGILYLRAEHHRELAEQSAGVAREKAAELREELYYNSISLAEKAHLAGNPIEMNTALERCPPDLRGWEYWHLRRLTDESVLAWRAHAIGDAATGPMMLSPDGQFLVTTGLEQSRFPPVLRTTKIWNAHTGELVCVLDAGNVALQGAATFSPDGSRIAVGGRTFRFRVYETGTWRLLYEVDRGRRGREQSTNLLAFSGDSTKIVMGDAYREGVSVHDATTGELLRTLAQPLAVTIDAHADGRRVIIGSINGTASIWDVETGERLAHLVGHAAQVRGVAFAPDGTHVVTDSWDGRVRGWELPGGALRFTTEAQPGAATRAWGLRYSPDGRYLARGFSIWIELWDARRAQRIRRLLGHQEAALQLGFAPDSTRVAALARDGYVRIWDLRGGRGRRTLDDSTEAVAWSPDGRWIATLANGGRLRLYDAAVERPVWEQHAGFPHQWASGVAFSPDSKLLAIAGADGDIDVRDVATGIVVSTTWAHMGRAGLPTWSPDGRRLASLGTDQFLRVWAVASGELVREILVGTGEVMMGTAFAVRFSPDGARVAASARDNAIRVWDIESGALLLTLTGHENSVGGLRFTSAGDRIVTCSYDGSLRVWDAHSGECVRTLRSARQELRHLALMPDDRHVFAAGNELHLWDVVTGRQVLRISDEFVSRVALCPDGRRLACATENGVVIWDGSPLE